VAIGCAVPAHQRILLSDVYRQSGWFRFAAVPPTLSVLVALVAVFATTVFAVWTMWHSFAWFSWMTIVGFNSRRPRWSVLATPNVFNTKRRNCRKNSLRPRPLARRPAHRRACSPDAMSASLPASGEAPTVVGGTGAGIIAGRVTGFAARARSRAAAQSWSGRLRRNLAGANAIGTYTSSRLCVAEFQ